MMKPAGGVAGNVCVDMLMVEVEERKRSID